MFLYLGDVWMSPHLYTPCTFVCPRGVHPLHMPPYSSVPLCFWRLCSCGGCNGLPFVLGHSPLHHPCLGVPPLQLHPHTQLLVPFTSVSFKDISILGGHFPSVEGFGGVSPSVGGVGASALEMSYAHSLYFCSALCLTF